MGTANRVPSTLSILLSKRGPPRGMRTTVARSCKGVVARDVDVINSPIRLNNEIHTSFAHCFTTHLSEVVNPLLNVNPKAKTTKLRG